MPKPLGVDLVQIAKDVKGYIEYADAITAKKRATVASSRPTSSVQLSQKTVSGERIKTLTAAKVRYSRRAKYVKLQRFITGILLFQPKKAKVWMLLVLYDNQLNLQKLAERDPSFKGKFGKELDSLTNILKKVKVDLHHPLRAINQFHSELKTLQKFALPERNWKDFLNVLHNNVWLEVSSSEGVEKCQLPPKKVIGKGYTDKGSAREAHNGDPKWQELALADLQFLHSLNKLRQMTQGVKGLSK